MTKFNSDEYTDSFKKDVLKILEDYGQTGSSIGLNLCFVAAKMFKENEMNTPRAEIIRKALNMENF